MGVPITTKYTLYFHGRVYIFYRKIQEIFSPATFIILKKDPQ
jgi:hypothetical protein